MFEFIKRLFCKEQLPKKQPVVLTGLQVAEMQHYTEVDWPKPPDNLGKGSIVFFLDKHNEPQSGAIQAIKCNGPKTTYRVAYGEGKEKSLQAGTVFPTRELCLTAAIGEHWKAIRRYYKGLQDAGEANKSVIEYTLGKVKAHKDLISFLEVQKEKQA